MSDSSDPPARTAPPPRLWGLLFVVSMFATAAIGIWLDQPPAGLVLMVLPMLFLVPMMREAQRRRAAKGEASAAATRYDRRTALAMFAYLACLAGGVYLHETVPSGSALLWPAATLPILPMLAVIWAMGRYLAEETDEYLRHQVIMGALIGLAAVLVAATAWGFLETFGLVPHVWAWWVVPFFAVTRDMGRAWLKARGQ